MIAKACRRTLWCVMVVAVAAQADSARTIVLVRHAERAGGTSPEVGISEAGQCRAGILAGMLTDAGVSRIFTSEVARTQQTAAPLAGKLMLKPEVVPAKDVDGLVAKLRSANGVTLVVGHSNTLPRIVQLLGAGEVSPIADNEYDRLWVVTLDAAGASAVTLRYKGCGR
jgi:phosphohistidine phosphatase SixA